MDRIADVAGLLVTGAIIIAVVTNSRTRANVTAVMSGFADNLKAMTATAR